MTMALHYSSATPEWYTPPAIVERVVSALGCIDLDPCSNSHEHPAVPATRHLTSVENGLLYEWSGRVYMNPPYGRPIAQWARKAAQEFESGRVDALIALVPARVDTAWWRRLTAPATLICFVAGRLHFSGHPDAAPFPSALVYLGHDSPAFSRAVSGLGDLYQKAIA